VANHLTPDELAEEVGMDAAEIIRICDEQNIPWRNIGGRIDKTLFGAQVTALENTPQYATA
jgi:hypothetical protein